MRRSPAVAARAGVGISALYRRYPSKEELLRKLCSDGLKEYIAAAEDALADDGDAWKVFRRFTHRIVEADAHTLTARLARTLEDGSEAVFRDATKAQDLGERVFKRAQKRGAVRTDAVAEDMANVFEQLSAIRGPNAKRTARAAQALPDAAARRPAPAQEGAAAPRPGPAMERPADRVTNAEVPGNLSARLISALSLMSEATLVLDEQGAVLAANDLALRDVRLRRGRHGRPAGHAPAAARDAAPRRAGGRRAAAAHEARGPPRQRRAVPGRGERALARCRRRARRCCARCASCATARWSARRSATSTPPSTTRRSAWRCSTPTASTCASTRRSAGPGVHAPEDRQSDIDAAWEILDGRATRTRPRSASCAPTGRSAGCSRT